MKTYCIIVVLLIVIYYLWNQTNETCKIYLFYKPDCDKCKDLKLDWAKIENKLKNTTLSPIQINISEPENIKLKKNFNIEKVPSVVKVFNNGIRIVFNGNNNYNDIMEWIYKLE
jgi:hypothetical protein